MSKQAKNWTYIGFVLFSIILAGIAESSNTNIFIASFLFTATLSIVLYDKLDLQDKDIKILKEKIRVLEAARECSDKK